MTTLLELPEDIIYDVVYRLNPTNKEIMSLSLVAKKFFDLMQKRSELTFEHASASNATCQKRYREELSYMVSTLKRYQEKNIPLTAFVFIPEPKIPASTSDEDAYEQCIELATNKDLKYLFLWMPEEKCYVMGQPVFELKSLETLFLCTCKLQPGRIAWRNLKHVYLTLVDFDEVVLENIIRSCPLIEVFWIGQCCRNIPNFAFKVTNLVNLKRLHIGGFSDQSFKLMNAAEYMDRPSCYRNLMRLELDVAIIDENLFTNMAQTFPQLQYLCIVNNKNLRRIDIWSSSLKKIRLESNEELQKIYFNVPNVDDFVLLGMNISKLSFAGNSNGWTSRIKLIEWKEIIGASWFLELNQLLASLKGSEISVMVHFRNKVYIDENDRITDHDDDSVSFREEIEGIEDFSIETSYPKFCLHSAKVVLDGILWICRPKMVIFRHWCDLNDDVASKLAWRRDMEKDPQFHEHSAELFPELKTDKLVKLLEGYKKKDKFIVGFNLKYLKIQQAPLHDGSYSLWPFFLRYIIFVLLFIVIIFITNK